MKYFTIAAALTVALSACRSVPPEPDAPTPTQAALLGDYGSESARVHVAEDGRELWLLDGGNRNRLVPRYDRVFRVDGTGETIRFDLDDDGEVLGLRRDGTRLARAGGEADGAVTFTIKPVAPIEELARRAALASPPTEVGRFFEPDLVELVERGGLKLDLRYATTNNFLRTPFYPEARGFLQRPAAEALARVTDRLREWGLGVVIFDAYRPWRVTKMFWDATPATLKHFVADPSKGSRHNRGCAVDLSLYNLETGIPVTMPSGYDEFESRAYPDYPGGSARARWHRELLRTVMEAEGFTVYKYEWWHFDLVGWKHYPILNRAFSEL